jgi:hypothetical protein
MEEETRVDVDEVDLKILFTSWTKLYYYPCGIIDRLRMYALEKNMCTCNFPCVAIKASPLVDLSCPCMFPSSLLLF